MFFLLTFPHYFMINMKRTGTMRGSSFISSSNILISAAISLAKKKQQIPHACPNTTQKVDFELPRNVSKVEKMILAFRQCYLGNPDLK